MCCSFFAVATLVCFCCFDLFFLFCFCFVLFCFVFVLFVFCFLVFGIWFGLLIYFAFCFVLFGCFLLDRHTRLRVVAATCMRACADHPQAPTMVEGCCSCCDRPPK